MRTVSVVAALLAAAVSSAAAQRGGGTPTLSVHDAWARPSMPGQTMSAVYAVVENPGVTPVAITGLGCDVARSSELHESLEENGIVRMRPVPKLEVPAGGRVELRPGGYHVMLMGLTRTLTPGDRVRCLLRAASALVGRFEAEVRAP